MVNHSSICHKFCNQIPNERTNTASWRGSSVFSTGKSIYSYGVHFCMGFFGEYRKKKILFINTSSYSVSTSKHQGYLRAAINENFQNVVLPCNFQNTFHQGNKFDSGRWSYLSGKDRYKVIKGILETHLAEAKQYYESFFRARKPGTWQVEGIEEARRNLVTEINALGLKIKGPQWVIDKSKIREHLAYREKRNKILEAKAEKRFNERRAAKKIADMKETIKHNLDFKYPRTFTSLKVVDNQIKTSNHNSISIPIFKHYFRVFLSVLSKRASFNKDISVGGYQGLHIKKNGLVKVGCTRFFPDDVMDIGRQLEIV